jgi:hypothetical protein
MLGCNCLLTSCLASLPGFSIIFPVSDLNVFSAAELALLFGNPVEDWSRSSKCRNFPLEALY